MTDQHKPKSIEVDYRGKPITSGIPVRNNKEYAAKAGGMIFVTHFLFHPLAVIYWCVVGLFAIPFVIPGFVLIGIANPSDGLAPQTNRPLFFIGVVVLAIGVLAWLWYTVKFTKRLIKRFGKATEMRFVGDYRGPGANTLEQVRQRNQS